MDTTCMEMANSEVIWMQRPTLSPLPESKYSPEFYETMIGICNY